MQDTYGEDFDTNQESQSTSDEYLTTDYVPLTNSKYQCFVCAKNFRYKSDLDRHFRSHTGEKPPSVIGKYQCDECDKNFRFKSDYDRHYTLHTGEKPWRCEICGKCFTRRYGLTSHMQTSHKADSVI